MFKTIFSKLIAVFIVILLFSFSVTGFILYYSLGNFVAAEKVKVLNQSGEKINGFLNFYLQNQDNPIVLKFFQNTLESYSVNTRSVIWIVDNRGYIKFASPEITGELKDKLTDENGQLRLPDERQYKKVMLGTNEGYVKEIGDFYGLFKFTGQSWLTIEKPFKYKDKEAKEITAAAVFLHTRLPEVQNARIQVFKLFMVSVGVSVLISILLVYIFSLKISRPLKEINNAARVIAGGEFSNRLSINSNDEIGELANTFNQMASDLQNLEEMRRGFIANVSHELRTPMTSIRGFIEGILDGTVPPERQKDYLVIVRDETNRLNRLVNDLLDLAKLEAGEMDLVFKDFNINELLRRCIIKLESLIVKKDIEIEAEFEEEDMYVNADSDAIERVVINLVHNAIKFTPEKGKIKLSTSRKKDKIVISIEDTGIGIDSNEIDLIWDRFYKSDKSKGRDKTGTGLGLAIVKNIINEHDQEIWVESQLGEGTRFIFTLGSSQEDIND